MDFDDSPEEAAFRREAHDWLGAHAPQRDPARSGPGAAGQLDRDRELEHVRRSKEWQATLYEGGWAGITWPREHGGRGGTPIQAIIFGQEQARFDVPSGVFAQGIGMAGPTIMAHGSAEQQERFLRPMLRGDEVWCQLFSEPGAGSDLANLSTRAERDGDEFVVNGQKVWTSSAHYADLGILLARTDFDAPKHRGITYFLVDMRTPGIDVRPLRQATGAAHFNEVFLSDVRIPADQVVGPVNGGWGVTVTTLANERMLIGGGQGAGDAFGDLVQLAASFGRNTDAVARQHLAEAFIRVQLLKYLGWRVQTAISKGQQPGPESSVLKLALSRHLAATGDLVMELQGPAAALLDYDDPESGVWPRQFLGQWSSRIGGGTEQIQRNIIGERVLGLPAEPRLDKDVAFRAAAGAGV
ncbi:MAG TPA: acyl-CoA dehydrogenase family protein [Acidimicrobiales bacterium]|nr:acyl-CoA dehydrogenase family protein [Acidimicrobiales bacterium]